MKKNISKSAFTLIELIVSSLLVAIVILGIVSINSVLSNNNQDYGQKYLVKSETQTTLNHILNNAALAIGSANTNDEGILIGAAVGDANSFCIHQAGTSTAGGNNVVNSANDIWLCYSWTAATNQINWCAETYGPIRAVPVTADPRGATSCSAAVVANLIANPATASNTTFLGTANTGFANLPPVFTSTTTQTLFSITLRNCLDNSAASCNGNGLNPGSTPGTSSNPADNPEVQVSGSIIPLEVSS